MSNIIFCDSGHFDLIAPCFTVRLGPSICKEPVLVNFSPKIAKLTLVWLYSVAFCPLLFADAKEDFLEVPAGRVSLVLGEARLISAGGKEPVTLRRGMEVWAGDRIETESSGHAHIRFIDEALLSVRPRSTLEIKEYRFVPDDPSKSAVKFNLIEGVARAISGDAAKAARDRFRLNTPVAAIGVRGTDFVVSALRGSTKALVNEGSIVIAPFSASCSAESLGPCANNGLELARSNLQLASLRAEDSIPSITASQNVRAPSSMQRQLQSAISLPSDLPQPADGNAVSNGEAAPTEQNLQNDVLLESVTSPVVRASAQVAAEKVAATDFIPVAPISVSASGTVEDFDYTPPYLMTSASLSDRQLVWGRYSESSILSNRLALDYEDASEAKKVTVGTTSFGLFRKDANPRRVSSDLGLVGFQLTSAQAVFNSQTGIAVMQVNDGNLDIDLQSNTFATTLFLDHNLTGKLEFSASGRVFDGGFLRVIEPSQRLAGAISYDGSEAGYFFEKTAGGGIVSGLTLWDSK